MSKVLHKSKNNKMLAGVCGGIAEYFNIDPTLVRIGTVVLTFISGFGILAYIIICLIMPSAETAGYSDDDIEHMKRAETRDSENSQNHSEQRTGNSTAETKRSDSDFDKYFK